jgi:hypothetical protein
VFGFLLARQFAAPGSEMDEGAVLAYSGRVLHGAVPWRDFQTFYGPGNLWLVGLAGKVFGSGVVTERAVGACYRVVAVLALFVLARRFGRAAGLLALAICAFLVPGQGVMALALWGSLAFALAGLTVLVVGIGRATGGSRDRLLLAAGALSACALLVRFDLLLAVVLPAAVLLPMLSWRERRRVLGAFAVVVAAYVPYALLVGSDGLERLVRQLQATEPGRRLPFPAPNTFPGMLLTPAIVVSAVLVVAGATLAWRERDDLGARALLASGLLSAALLPTALSRADGVHVVPFAIVPLALLPALVSTLLRGLDGNRAQGRSVSFVGSVTGLALCAIAVLIVVAAGPAELRTIVTPQPLVSYRVTAGERWFPVKDRRESTDAQKVVDALQKLAKPDQSLFVGPADLRRTNYNDTYLYYLLPQLTPASFYMEMNPQTANLPGSGLALELQSADWLLLTRRYRSWHEANSSSKLGSTLPNRIVARDFCTVFSSGDDLLLRRCR